MLMDYRVTLTMLHASSEHVVQVESLLHVICEMVEFGGGEALLEAGEIQVNDQEVEREIEAAFSQAAE